MAFTGSLRKNPDPENLPALFSIQRALALHSEVLSSLPLLIQTIEKEFPDSELAACLAEDRQDSLSILATAPDSLKESLAERPLKMGSYPCGFALEKEELVFVAMPGGRLCIEAPIAQESRIVGAISLLLPKERAASPGAKGTKTPDSKASRAAELLQWTCYLVEEALGLRKALRGRIAKEDKDLEPSGIGSGWSSGRSAGKTSLGDSGDESIAFHGIIGSSAGMKEVFRLIDQVATTDATVLLTGESGTGKELAARAIHECSKRSSGPFVAVNCAALPESLIESELFGHEKGAFTGAVSSRQGRFEAAQDGSLFLDEIGDLSLPVQVKLLRILQEHSFERVGGTKSLKSNARIITATHRDLQKEVLEGRFREDLFFRLNVFPIRLPPLRERGADILLLADHFAETLGRAQGKTIKRISSPALDLLMIYHWPGNVRELENCMARAIILSKDSVIHAYDLPPSLQSASSTGTEPASTFDGAIARLEKEMLVEALKIELGNSVQAARRLGITERRFRFALQRYKLDYRQFRTKM